MGCVGGAGRTSHQHPTRHLNTHVSADQDLHERGARQAASLRHDHPHPGKDETPVVTAHSGEPTSLPANCNSYIYLRKTKEMHGEEHPGQILWHDSNRQDALDLYGRNSGSILLMIVSCCSFCIFVS